MRRPKTCGDDQVAPIEDSPRFAVCGLTKREYFAALALQGLFAAKLPVSSNEKARLAVLAADQLIDALNDD